MHSIFKVAKVGYYRGRKKAVKNVIVEVGFNEKPPKEIFQGFLCPGLESNQNILANGRPACGRQVLSLLRLPIHLLIAK